MCQVFAGHSGPVSAGCFTPDGKSVVTVGGEGDSSLRVWSPKSGECSVTLQRHPFHEEREWAPQSRCVTGVRRQRPEVLRTHLLCPVGSVYAMTALKQGWRHMSMCWFTILGRISDSSVWSAMRTL